MSYLSTKTYNHSEGLSCAFRQWRAEDSHCRFIHGYSLKVRIEFKAFRLNDKNWVVDFGGMKEIKKWLKETFDHKLLVAKDDPKIKTIKSLEAEGLAQVVEVDAVGCEAFAFMIFQHVEDWLDASGEGGRVRVHQVEVSEHEGNSGVYGFV